MKGIYLAAYRAYHPNYNLDYNDIKQTSEHINIIGNMLYIDLSNYDYIIATPPCNYWSRANINRIKGTLSEYSLSILTKYLLPGILIRLQNQEKPYIIENVRNHKLFSEYGLFNGSSYVYEIGRHTYWTNVPFNMSNIKQPYDFRYGGKSSFTKPLGSSKQGGNNVHQVIEYWLEIIHNKELEK